MAHYVKMLMDYVLSAEDYVPPGETQSVNLVIWQIIGMAFDVHCYVGTYLDWQMLEDRLASLNERGDDPEFRQLIRILARFSYANDEHALEVVKPYLDHPHVNVRWTAVECLKYLIWHLAHYCAEVRPMLVEAEKTLQHLKKAPETPDKWQQIKACLEQEERDGRPYFHFSSI